MCIFVCMNYICGLYHIVNTRCPGMADIARRTTKVLGAFTGIRSLFASERKALSVERAPPVCRPLLTSRDSISERDSISGRDSISSRVRYLSTSTTGRPASQVLVRIYVSPYARTSLRHCLHVIFFSAECDSGQPLEKSR